MAPWKVGQVFLEVVGAGGPATGSLGQMTDRIWCRPPEPAAEKAGDGSVLCFVLRYWTEQTKQVIDAKE